MYFRLPGNRRMLYDSFAHLAHEEPWHRPVRSELGQGRLWAGALRSTAFASTTEVAMRGRPARI